MIHKDFLIIGHPRCGSKFVSYFLTLLGLPTSHENSRSELSKEHFVGLSSWAFAIEHEKGDGINPRYGLNGSKWRCEFSFKKTIVHLRNPFDSFSSIMNENNEQWSLNIRKKYIFKKTGKVIEGNNLEIAILCYLYWYKILLQRNDIELYFRIEDETQKLYNYLKEQGYSIKQYPDIIETKVNSKPKHKKLLTREDFENVNPDIIKELNNFCETNGYPKLNEYIF